MILTVGAVLFACAVVLYVLQPLLTGTEAPLDRGWQEITEAEARTAAALKALRDVEYDYHTGKLDDRDYESLRGELTAEAVAALREEEQESGVEAHAAGAHDTENIEREILRVREQFRAGTACGECGHRNPDGSRFCAACGQRVRAA